MHSARAGHHRKYRHSSTALFLFLAPVLYPLEGRLQVHARSLPQTCPLQSPLPRNNLLPARPRMMPLSRPHSGACLPAAHFRFRAVCGAAHRRCICRRTTALAMAPLPAHHARPSCGAPLTHEAAALAWDRSGGGRHASGAPVAGSRTRTLCTVKRVSCQFKH